MAQQHNQQQRQRGRTRRGRGVALVAAASAAAVLLLFSASRAATVEAAAEESSSTIAASSSAPASLSPLGPVFIAEEAGDDHRVEASEEELILEGGALESLMQVSASGEDSDEVDADARLQAAVEGAQAAAAASAPVCSSVESCLALCPTENFLVAGGATEGSVEESVSFFFEEREAKPFARAFDFPFFFPLRKRELGMAGGKGAADVFFFLFSC